VMRSNVIRRSSIPPVWAERTFDLFLELGGARR